MCLNAQNETLQIMALKVLCGIASGIAVSGCYSIMADESTVQATLNSLKFAYLGGLGNESMQEYIGLMPDAQTNADRIVVCIKDVLLRMSPRIQDAHGQRYDGCSTMTRTKNGLSAQS